MIPKVKLRIRGILRKFMYNIDLRNVKDPREKYVVPGFNF